MPFQRSLSAWWSWCRPFIFVFLPLQLLTRIGLAIYSGSERDFSAVLWIKMFVLGECFDLQVMFFFLVPVILVGLAIQPKNWPGKTARALRAFLMLLLCFTWIFTGVSEFFFWEEFGTRFNFIAVDYLVYTQEVIGNIMQSYPVIPIMAVIAVFSAIVAIKTYRTKIKAGSQTRGTQLTSVALILIPFVLLPLVKLDWTSISAEQSANELAANGVYNLFSAFRNNELDYKRFYLTKNEKQISTHIRDLLHEDENSFVSPDPDDITRVVRRKGPELHKNVIFVVMESQGADFMKRFGNTKNLTPVLDDLTKKSLFFSDFYATGTRTVRGLEALTLSVPPTPGQSIVRRPGNENLFSLGFIFKDRGYDTRFIYGGHGYFDNMNAFFSGNGFDTVDRHDFEDSEITFSNVWGVADENLYDKALQMSDSSFAKHKPFLSFIMTTSNHRPYTFPDGRIDIPSKTGGRSGGVKYADFALGKFLKDAEKKPWFKNTVFVIVADHTAGAGGKIDLSLIKYHIPAYIYAPGFVKPRDFKYTASQIDLAPTLLDLLNFSYYTKFYGEDLIGDDDIDKSDHPHAFISNYQKIGLLKHGKLTVLEPKSVVQGFQGETQIDTGKIDPQLLLDTVTYYQFASGWKERMKRIPTIAKPLE